jgi:hypothetical protein
VALGDVLPQLIEIRTLALAPEEGNYDAAPVPTTESSPVEET